MPSPPKKLAEIKILPGVVEAITLLTKNSFLPIVVTNQPDVARGTSKLDDVNSINEFIGRETGVSHFYTCPHDDSDKCICRKPKPGLLEIATKDLDVDLQESFLVGDRWRDIEAGQAIGLHSFFIDYSYKETSPKPPFTRVSSLLEAVRFRLGVSNGLNN